MPQRLSTPRLLLFGVLFTLVFEMGIWFLYNWQQTGWTSSRWLIVVAGGVISFISGAYLEITMHRRAVRRFEQEHLSKHLDTYLKDPPDIVKPDNEHPGHSAENGIT